MKVKKCQNISQINFLPYLQYCTFIDQASELLKAVPLSNKTLLTYSLHQCFFNILDNLLLQPIRLHTEHL